MMRMKIAIRSVFVGLFPLLLHLPAAAEWREIEKFEDGIRIYADPAQARREGDIAWLAHLVRWAEPQEDPGQPTYRSTLVRTHYDCVNKREKYLSSLSFSGPMGDGFRVGADGREAERWEPVSEGAMEEKLWKIACEKP